LTGGYAQLGLDNQAHELLIAGSVCRRQAHIHDSETTGAKQTCHLTAIFR
jgi:hypothetical protein